MHALALLVTLAIAVPTAGQGADSASESVYAAWSNGPSTDPGWFPIGVWLQDPRLAPRYAELGVNTFVGLWQGPTREQLRLLKQADMSVVCGMNKLALEQADRTTIIGWMLEDEPDNKKTPPAKLQAASDRMHERDSTRPIWLNLGQGVANDRWKGRLSPREWYPKYVAAADIVSYDMYPVTNMKRANGDELLWMLGKGLARLEQWSRGQKPLWNMIECTRVHQAQLKPTPAQVQSEVWISLIHGSRGIVYFCHNFVPKTEPAALLGDPDMMAAIQAINARILRLAPALNAPSLKGVVEVQTNDPQAPVELMVKRLGGWTYIFAAGMRKQSVEASFEIQGLPAGTTVEVLDEERTLEVDAGRFKDAFGPFGIHLYRYRS